MTDRRFLASNGRVALMALKGQVSADRFTEGTHHSVTDVWTDLCAQPGGARDKHLLFGHAFLALDVTEGWAFGVDLSDGYVGYVLANALGAPIEPTHRIKARQSHVYSAADIKSPEQAALTFNALIHVVAEGDDFVQLAGGGFVPRQHVCPRNAREDDFITTAELFLGTPYLWGGNTGAGIDCSGLVQMAMWAAGLTCPRDSDLQAGLGTPVAIDDPLRRGDIVCWKGHVGLMRDAHSLIHANAHHMAVAIEPFAQARNRIAQKEFGEITTIRRLAPV